MARFSTDWIHEGGGDFQATIMIPFDASLRLARFQLFLSMTPYPEIAPCSAPNLITQYHGLKKGEVSEKIMFKYCKSIYLQNRNLRK